MKLESPTVKALFDALLKRIETLEDELKLARSCTHFCYHNCICPKSNYPVTPFPYPYYPIYTSGYVSTTEGADTTAKFFARSAA